MATDYSSVVAAVQFEDVATALIAVCALLAAPYVVRKGANLVLSMLGMPDLDGYYKDSDGYVRHVDD